MPATQISQWRTVGLAGFAIVALEGGLAISGHWPAASGQFPAFAGAVTGIVVAAAAKAWGEHKANAEAAAKAKEPAATILATGTKE
jgi:hypothetical protein